MPVDPAANPADLRRAVARALDGGPAVVAAGRTPDAPVPLGTAMVVPTSGSTGEPRAVALSAAALRASADATHARLGGAGDWLLALPATHVAGLQVVSRSVVGGGALVTTAFDRFTPDVVVRLEGEARGERRYLSLVPTQLHRVMDAGGPAVAALARLDAVLLGGAPAAPALLDRARAAGVPVVTAYGMTETCGGCVYDGVPLDGVRVRLGHGPAGPVVALGGPVLAAGYVGDPHATDAAFVEAEGSRWFRTNDLGAWDGATLRVLGRADDVILTGGVNVAPVRVEEVVAGLDGVGEACVVGVPDAEWGQAVVAVVTSRSRAEPLDGATLLPELRTRVTARLGGPAAPRRVVVVDALPLRDSGKVDRAACRALAERSGK
ncbi:AMP-binding protein [Paraoerskovia marina]|uniref:AMP-binding protein n=1 Tax=Paraoerskovia marina TaxID=545619 RepID=UPI000492C6A7|nr:AMP-binding protein [Paraoerskovia marina]